MLKVAIIGLGQMGQSYAKEALYFCDEVHLYDTDFEKLNNFKNNPTSLHNPFDNSNNFISTEKLILHKSVKTIFDVNIKLAIITTHKETHAQYAINFMNKDINVLVEKPMCCDITEAINMYKTSFSRKIKLFIGFSLHGTPAFIHLKKIIKENKNHISSIQINRLGVVPINYPTKVTANFDLISHDTDFFLQTIGEPSKEDLHIFSSRKCRKVWYYNNHINITMNAEIPLENKNPFHYSYILQCDNGKSYYYDNIKKPNSIILEINNEYKQSYYIDYRESVCRNLFLSVINALDYDYVIFLKHPLSVTHGLNCIKWLQNIG